MTLSDNDKPSASEIMRHERRATSRQTVFSPPAPPNKGYMGVDEMLRIAYDLGRGHSIRELGDEYHRSPSSVHRVKRLASGEIERIPTFSYTRPLLMHFIGYCLLSNPLTTGKEIADRARDVGINTSASTVNRIAKDMSFDSVLSQKQEKLSDKHKLYRVQFCLAVPTSTLKDLPWVFTDETMLVLNPTKKRVRVLRGLDADEKFIDVQGYPHKVMVWAAIGPNFKSELIRVTGTLNAAAYQNLLEQSQIFARLDERYGRYGYIFQQDGARPHTAASTRMFLSSRTKTLPDDVHWPAMSPDLNVIENLWGILKQRIRYDVIKGPDDLYNEAVNVWDQITIETINASIADFGPRLRTCREVNGECLNRYKSVLRGYRKSEEEGDRARDEWLRQKEAIALFLRQSLAFFTTQVAGHEHNEELWWTSAQICQILPDSVRLKTGLPGAPVKTATIEARRSTLLEPI